MARGGFIMSVYAPLFLLLLFAAAYALSPKVRQALKPRFNRTLLSNKLLNFLLACFLVLALMRLRGALSPGMAVRFGFLFNLAIFAALCWAALLYARMGGGTPWRQRFKKTGPRKPERPHAEGRADQPPPPPPPPPPAFDPYATLGVRPEASKKEISARYRQLVSQFHPDKLHDAGPDMKKMAHEKLLEVQRAYETLSKKR